MNTREMARRQELCQTLNMNFDEANELFSTETLSSMTMAKVNGGVWLKLAEIIIMAGITYFTTRNDNDGPTKTIRVEIDDNTLSLLKQPSDSTFFRINADGSVEFKQYGTNKSPTPTPTRVN